MQELLIVDTFHLKDVFSADLYNNSIIEVNWNPSLNEIEKQHLVALTNAIKALGKGKKMRVYITTFDFLAINSEGRKYSSSVEGELYTLANAVLTDNLAKKILFNFYVKIDRPNVPIRAFQLRSEAFEWLLSIPNQ